MKNFVLNVENYNGCNFIKTEHDLDYVEIGTNDWDVMSMTHKNLKGLIIEPINLYLKNIPHNPNVIKVNCAISNVNKDDGFMYYVHPDIIEERNIVNCFKGMNKLDEPHMGHISHNLVDILTKEKCEVMTYFSLLQKYNINYVDFLKIDTEGHDYAILNNILDELVINPNYILPRYLYFENNGLTPLNIRTETIHRLYTYGYIHIFTKNDNTLLYNCTNFYLTNLKNNNICLPKNHELNNDIINSTNFFQDVHTYMTYGQVDLFKNMLKLNISNNVNESNIIWTTQQLSDYDKYNNKNNKTVNIIHGGGFIYSPLLKNPNLNIIVKSLNDYLSIDKSINNVGLFIGKYKCKEKLFVNIFNYRLENLKNIYNTNNFLMLNGFFNYNCKNILDTYQNIKEKYSIDLFGYDAKLGYKDVFDENINIEQNVLSKYKFYLHLKGNGYLCYSVVCAMLTGFPIIMSRDVYNKTLYSQFIPEELIILIDNENISCINENEIIPKIEYAMNISYEKYFELSQKLYIHGHFFREYYNFEIEHLYYFMKNLYS